MTFLIIRQSGRAATPEDEDMTGHRIVFQCLLCFFIQTIEAVAYIGDTGNQPYFVPGR